MVALEGAEGKVIIVSEKGAKGQSIVVVPQKGADDKTIVVQAGAESKQLCSCQKALKIKQLSYKKA